MLYCPCLMLSNTALTGRSWWRCWTLEWIHPSSSSSTRRRELTSLPSHWRKWGSVHRGFYVQLNPSWMATLELKATSLLGGGDGFIYNMEMWREQMLKLCFQDRCLHQEFHFLTMSMWKRVLNLTGIEVWKRESGKEQREYSTPWPVYVVCFGIDHGFLSCWQYNATTLKGHEQRE